MKREAKIIHRNIFLKSIFSVKKRISPPMTKRAKAIPSAAFRGEKEKNPATKYVAMGANPPMMAKVLETPPLARAM